MPAPGRAALVGAAAVCLLAAAGQAAPVVLGETTMSQVRTRFVPQPQIEAPSVPLAASHPTVLPAREAAISILPRAKPALRSGSSAGPAGLVADPPPTGSVLERAVPRPSPVAAIAARPRTLSNEEADQVTAAGFLFPVTSIINARALMGSAPMVFNPVARKNAIMRGVIVVPRPAAAMIVDISRF
jgi:hypothetical protein